MGVVEFLSAWIIQIIALILHFALHIRDTNIKKADLENGGANGILCGIFILLKAMILSLNGRALGQHCALAWYPSVLSSPCCVNDCSAGWDSKGLSHNAGYIYIFVIFNMCLWWIIIFKNVRDKRNPEYQPASLPCHHHFTDVVTET